MGHNYPLKDILLWNNKAPSLTIINVKVLNEWIKPQDQGHNVKNVGTHEKVLSQGIPMRNIKAL